MSYDLFIYPRSFNADAIRAHFASRPNYQVSETQALYSNDETGVYFTFDIIANPAPTEDEPAPVPGIAFNLNFFRPHTFALEAEPEVAAFLKVFDSRIEDPQTQGMGEDSYSRDGFMKGWSVGNRFAFTAMGDHSTAPPPWPQDPSLIEAIWKWNFGRAGLQQSVGEDTFVPRLYWFTPAEGVAPVAAPTWTQGVPTMIPRNLVSHVALVRKPRQSIMERIGLSRSGDKPKLDLRLVDVKDVARLPGVGRGEADGHTVVFTPMFGPSEAQKMFSGAWPASPARIVAAEHVCGADLVSLIGKV